MKTNPSRHSPSGRLSTPSSHQDRRASLHRTRLGLGGTDAQDPFPVARPVCHGGTQRLVVGFAGADPALAGSRHGARRPCHHERHLGTCRRPRLDRSRCSSSWFWSSRATRKPCTIPSADWSRMPVFSPVPPSSGGGRGKIRLPENSFSNRHAPCSNFFHGSRLQKLRELGTPPQSPWTSASLSL